MGAISSSAFVGLDLVDTAVSLLRGINVGGHRRVPMGELRGLYESLGFTMVTTYIQSGNVVFEYQGQAMSEVSKELEDGLLRRFGFEVPVVVRTSKEWHKVVENLPFGARKKGDSHVTFLSARPGRSVPFAEIERARAEGEELSVHGTEVYLFVPNGYGGTKLSNAFLERKLGVLATTRNWKTVEALDALAGRPSPPGVAAP